MSLPPLYLEGVRLFNERAFFPCHDVLEALWDETDGPEREFYQGLIQAAVALFHFGEGNLGGARRLCDSARRYLEPYRPGYLGLDLDRFLADFEFCFEELLAAAEYPHGAVLDEARLPRLDLTPCAGPGDHEPDAGGAPAEDDGHGVP